MKLIRASGSAGSESRVFGDLAERYRKRVIRTQRYATLTSPVTEVFAGLVLVLVIWAATVPAIAGTRMTPEATIAFLLAALKMMSPLKSLTQFPTHWAQAAASADRVFRVLDLPAVDVDRPGEGVARFERDIVFDQVSYRYEPDGDVVLDDVSFQVPKGQVLALVGPSGAGKTTLVEMLPRFWEPTGGTIRIDGVPLANLTRGSVRALMAVVGQDTILLNDTVHANIAYGMPEATRRGGGAGGPGRERRRSSSPGSRRATTPCWGSGEPGSPAVSGSGSPSRGPCSGTRRSSFSMRRPAPSIPNRNGWSSRPSIA